MRKIFLCGKNSYNGCPLRGCLNDIQNMADYLISEYGIAKKEIRMLTDGRATTAAEKEHLAWLADGAQDGDFLLWHNSGHGSTLAIRDTVGNVTTEHDCECPIDFDFTPDHAILDTDVMSIFSKLPSGVNLRIILDSCHSGEMARAINGAGKIFAIRRFGYNQPQPMDLDWRIQTAKDLSIKAIGFSRSIEHLQGVLLAGCESSGTSADAYIDRQYCGAFTYELLKTLRRNKEASLDSVIKSTRVLLSTDGYEQIPQIHGLESNQPFFVN